MRAADSSGAPAAGVIAAVVFDMDGVLFEGRNFWLDLHERYGGELAEAQALADRYLTRDYAMLAAKVAGELWRGRPAAPYRELVAGRPYQPGARETVARLRRAGIRTAIVSSGPDLLAERAQRELGIDIVRANGLEIRDDRLTGNATIRVADADKLAVALDVMRELGVEPSAVAAVGDSSSDVPLAEVVELPIAYDSSSERLSAVSRHDLRHGELVRVCDLVGLVEASG